MIEVIFIHEGKANHTIRYPSLNEAIRVASAWCAPDGGPVFIHPVTIGTVNGFDITGGASGQWVASITDPGPDADDAVALEGWNTIQA